MFTQTSLLNPFWRNTFPVDQRKSKHRNNAMRCVCVGEERDGEVMQL
jgi:hypothetical protein